MKLPIKNTEADKKKAHFSKRLLRSPFGVAVSVSSSRFGFFEHPTYDTLEDAAMGRNAHHQVNKGLAPNIMILT